MSAILGIVVCCVATTVGQPYSEDVADSPPPRYHLSDVTVSYERRTKSNQEANYQVELKAEGCSTYTRVGPGAGPAQSSFTVPTSRIVELLEIIHRDRFFDYRDSYLPVWKMEIDDQRLRTEQTEPDWPESHTITVRIGSYEKRVKYAKDGPEELKLLGETIHRFGWESTHRECERSGR